MSEEERINSNKPSAVRRALAMATSSLLAAPLHAVEESEPPSPWEFDSSILYYDEQDRVRVVKPVLAARKEVGEERFLDVRVVFDAMTGASPNGATPSSEPQTFTTPSGEDVYTVGRNQYPMRDFEDERVAASIALETPVSRMVRMVLGLNGSVETDYVALGGSALLQKDINNRLTTLSTGIAVSYELVKPDGNIPGELDTIALTAENLAQAASDDDDDDDNEEGGDDEEQKVIVDLLFGITQVVNKRTISQLNYTLGLSSGYLTDPYKIVSRVGATDGLPVEYLYEKRPGSRLRNSLYWHTAHQFDEDSIHFSYRFFWDDWGIVAHTADLRYRYELGSGHYLQPHLRYYTQTAADFYRHSLVSGERTPRYVSADLRLGEFVSTTLGLKYGMPLLDGELSLRIEQMRQQGDSYPGDAVGDQKNHDLFPTLEAAIVQLSYSFIF